MKQIIYIIITIAIFGFTNSNDIIDFRELTTQQIDTTYIVDHSSIKLIVKKGKLILAEKEYFLDNEIILDTTTLEKTKFIPEGPGALGGAWIQYTLLGRIKATGQTKNEFGCWMNSGTFEYYETVGDLEEKGPLIKTVHYDNWINEGEGCHSTVHDITQKEFYLDGQLKSEKHFQEGYEEGEQNPVGEWKYFNKQGKVIRTEKYKMMYNKK